MIAAADVFQEVVRFREIEGQRQKLDTTVVQRETWIKTKERMEAEVGRQRS